jgi:hypothetical protein
MMDKKDCDKSCGDDAGFDSFVESIEEEIRGEKWLSIWNKYGKIISFSIIALVVSVGVYHMWLQQDRYEREAVSHSFSMAMNSLSHEKVELVVPAFRELSSSPKEPYGSLAKLMYAAILRTKNDRMAIALYKQISENEKVDSTFREFAYIMYVNTSLEIMSTKEITEELDGFIDTLSKKYINCAWRIIALETLAFCYIKYGKNDLAKESLIKLAKMPGVPQAMAERARILIGMLNSQS